MKSSGYYFCIISVLICGLLAALPATSVFNDHRGDDNVLMEAFQASGAAEVGTNINVYSASRDMFLQKEEVESIVKSLAAEMEVDYHANERIEHYGDDFNQLSLLAKDSQGRITAIIVHSMDFTDLEDSQGGYETNIVLDVSSDGGLKGLSGTERRIKKAVEGFIKGARVTSCVIGSYEGDMSEEDMEALIGRVLESVGASEVEKAVYDGMISVSAYSPRIRDYLTIGDNRINLNVAMRYNSFEGRTFIWLGSPVISLEY